MVPRPENEASGEYIPEPRETTTATVASTLAVMSLERHVANGGTLEFPSLGLIIGRQELFGPKESQTDDTE